MAAPAIGADEWDKDLRQIAVMGTGSNGQGYGEVLASGDLNDDGMDDIVVAAPGASAGAGEVSVIFGSVGEGQQNEEDVRNWWPQDTTNGVSIGASLLVADVDDDGVNDLLVGNPQVGSSNIGEVWVFFGPLADAPTTAQTRANADVVILGASGDQLGASMDYKVAPSSGDRLLAIGATRTSTNDGAVYVVDAGLLTTGTQAVTAVDLRAYTGVSNEKLGTSVAFTDYGLAMSAPNHDDGSGNRVSRALH
ncbi:MAG: FG-GAP repeat protein [Myxococcota bacterium]